MRPEFFFSNYFRDISPDEIQSFRNKSLKQITKNEWPKYKKSEFWKYTNPNVFFEGIDKLKSDDKSLDTSSISPIKEGVLTIFDKESGLEVQGELPDGVTISKLDSKSLALLDANNSSPKKEVENMVLLNNSYINSGFYLKIEANKSVNLPIQIVHLKGDSHVFRKNIIEIGKFSKATIVETYISDNKNNLFYNLDTDIKVEESASLSHYKLELSNETDRIFNNVNVNINKDAYYNNFYFTNGGNKIKNNIISNLMEEGAQTELNGLYLLKNKNHVDNSTAMNHVKPNTKSKQLYKGLLKDNSIAIFDGLVEIFEYAKLSDSNQLNQTMLLSEKATINSKPQLVIGNDDVKCSHGSTSGQIDKNQLFYLQSRGMSESDATMLLSKAFVVEVINTVEETEIRNYLIDTINESFWSDNV